MKKKERTVSKVEYQSICLDDDLFFYCEVVKDEYEWGWV